MTATEILTVIKNGDYEFYGLRADRAGIQIGDTFDNSRQWYQDWQEWWGEFPADDYNADPDHPYNKALGCWEDGELDGTCSIGITRCDENSIAAALELVSAYIGENVYLIAGDDAEGGNDIGEIIIRDARCVAIVK